LLSWSKRLSDSSAFSLALPLRGFELRGVKSLAIFPAALSKLHSPTPNSRNSFSSAFAKLAVSGGKTTTATSAK
jgi:hypothetical protein